MRPALSLNDLAEGVAAGDRGALARAITLVESKRADHQAFARDLVQRLLPSTGRAIRIGITGVPGVGKSTTIDTFGSNLTTRGHRVAVLAVDPSSSRTGGSILGDKTRMAKLSMDFNAFIRPSPSSGTLGGVASRTRESMLLCEAAGFDVILIETVGVGQSETAVADMTDLFLVLMLPGAGDELQGIKKGVLELADIVAVNKADGDGTIRAYASAAEYRAALHVMAPRSTSWSPPVLTISGLANQGLDVVWEHVLAFRQRMEASGEFSAKRQSQQVKWMWTILDDRIREALRRDSGLRARLPELEAAVAAGAVSPMVAAQEIWGRLCLSG